MTFGRCARFLNKSAFFNLIGRWYLACSIHIQLRRRIFFFGGNPVEPVEEEIMRTLQVLPAVVLAAALAVALPAAADRPAPPASADITTMSAPAAVAANPRLAARIQPFLPEKMDVQKAADGFQDIVTFLATVHVAHNQRLP